MTDRRWVGFHVQHSDQELDESTLRWWRCDPARVLDNELLVVTYPVAVYRILDRADTIVRPDESTPRHGFTGQLLARVHLDVSITFA